MMAQTWQSNEQMADVKELTTATLSGRFVIFNVNDFLIIKL